MHDIGTVIIIIKFFNTFITYTEIRALIYE